MSSCPAGCKRSQHQHGDRSFFVAHRCTCRPCRDANRDYERNRSRQKVYGRWNPYVDAGPAREHIRALMAAGMGWKRVAAASRVSDSVVCHLLYGKRGKAVARIRAFNAAAILAVGLDLAAGVRVDPTGTRRRLQALQTQGWSLREIAARLGWSHTNLCALASSERMVVKGTADLVAALYDELWDTAPEHETRWQQASLTRVIGRATRMGWAPPLAWDDDTIDDPAASPSDWERAEDRRGRPIADVVEDCLFMAAEGETLSGAAARLGYTEAVLDRLLVRAGHAALVRRLRSAA